MSSRRARGSNGASRGSACVLVSGGMDSAVLLHTALQTYRSVQPLYVRTGMVWEAVEIRFLRSYLRAVRSPRLLPLSCIDVPMADVYGAHWSTTGKRSPGFHAGDASVYLPGRNIALFSKAATFCSLRKIPVLLSGILQANPFPDGTSRFFRAMERALSAGLGGAIRIRTPFRRIRKEAVLGKGRGLPLHLTFSCINPKRGSAHCGNCCKCAERMLAFRDAGIRDPTRYAVAPGLRLSAWSVPGPSRGRSASRRATTTRLAP
jgi:7-cyano-7-deazaguanine synthase